jgi:hypothetical protein
MRRELALLSVSVVYINKLLIIKAESINNKKSPRLRAVILCFLATAVSLQAQQSLLRRDKLC